MPWIEDPPGSGLWTLTSGLVEDSPGLYTDDPDQTWVQWRDATLGGPSLGSTSYFLRELVGWEEMPSYKTDTVAVSGGHGTYVAPLQFEDRIVTASGWCVSRAARNALMQGLQASLTPGLDTTVVESLTVNHAGRQLSADARVVRFTLEPEVGWALGRFGWVAQWLCSDPLRYGPWLSGTAVLPQPGAGLALPLALPQAMPDSIPGGLFSVLNDGSALSRAIYTMKGPITNPGVLLNSGTAYQRQVRYDRVLTEGETLVIDTSGGGSGLFNGEYRPPAEDSGLAADLVLRPGANTVQAVGVAGISDPLPSISVAFRPAYW